MLKIKDIPTTMIPGGFIERLPKECTVCGSTLEITEPLTDVVCSNLLCKEKITYRTCKLVEKMGLDSYIREEEIKEFIDTRGLTSPYGILAYNCKRDGEFVGGYGIEESQALNKALNRRRGMLLWEYIDLGVIKGLEGNIEKIVGEHNNIVELYTDILEGGVRYVQSRLVEETEGVYVNAVIAYNALITYKKELELYIKVVVIEEKTKSKGIYFVIDNENMTRQEVIEYIMTETGRKFYLYETKNLESCDFIYKGDTNTDIKTSLIQELEGREIQEIGQIIQALEEA